MNKAVFFGRIKNREHISSGGEHRIREIDKNFSQFERVYIDINIKNLKPKKTNIEENCFSYKVSILRFLFVFKLMQNAKLIYCHGFGNFSKAFFFSIFSNGKIDLIIDSHGVAVEEMKYEKKVFKLFLLYWFELLGVRRANKIIVVTKAMMSYYSKKYSKYERKLFYYPIISNTLFNMKISKIKDVAQKVDGRTVIIYSGGTQKWQNIDDMVSFVSSICDNKNLFFIFLSKDWESLKISFTGILNDGNSLFQSVTTDEIGFYYSISHYGLIFRDYHVLNEVANPTKMLEYLYFGIIPIVKLEKIGDFYGYGYEYLKYDKLNVYSPKKSQINQNLAIKIIQDAKAINFLDILKQ